MAYDANGVRAQIQFIDSRILKIVLDNNLPLSQQSLDFECNIDYALGEIITIENGLQGVVKLSLVISSKEKRKKLLTLQIDIEGAFSCSSEMTQDTFVQFLRLNGVSMLYSIARTNIMTITGLSYPGATIRLPMLNIAALNEMKDMEEDK